MIKNDSFFREHYYLSGNQIKSYGNLVLARYPFWAYELRFSETKMGRTLVMGVFGGKFIVLPNAMYGNWEGALYDGNMRLPAAEKKKIRHERLKTIR